MAGEVVGVKKELTTPLGEASIEDGRVIDLTDPNLREKTGDQTVKVHGKRKSRVDARVGGKKPRTLTDKKENSSSNMASGGVGQARSTGDTPEPMTLEFRDDGVWRDDGTRTRGLPGHVKKIEVVDFMCHEHMTMEFAPHVTFISGKNGSGKSASLQALQCSLGVNATKHGKNASLSKLIRTGADEALIKVTIWNKPTADYEAYRHDVYGDSITIERRITTRTHSWIFRAANNRIISRKKEELEHILHTLGLNASNPVTVMTQNTARGLLGSTTSKADHEKYDLYMDATQLGTIAENIAVTKHCLTQMSEHVEKIGDEYDKLKSKVGEVRSRKEKLERLEHLNQELQDLETVFAMEIVHEQESMRDDLKSKLEGDVIAQMTKATEEIAEKQKDLEEKEESIKKQNEFINNFEANAESMRAKIDALKAQRREAVKALQHILKVIDRNKHMLLTEQSRKKDAKEALEDLRKDQADHEERANDLVNEHLEQLKVAKEKRSACNEKVRELEKCIGNVDGTVNVINKQITNECLRKTTIEKNKKECVQQLMSLKKSSTNSLYEFGGEKVIQAMRRIDEACKRGSFAQKPIGPIGQYLGITDVKYARAIECAIGMHLNSFLVGSEKDLHALRGILRSSGFSAFDMPNISITNLRRPLYSIPAEKMPSCTTALGVITCKEDVKGPVMNYLVDMGKVDQTALSLNDDATVCSRLAKDSRVNKVFDAHGTRYTYRGSTLAVEGQSKKFRNKVPRLGVSREDKVKETEASIRNLDHDLQQAESEVARLRQKLQQAEGDRAEYDRQLNQAKARADEAVSNFEILENTQMIPQSQPALVDDPAEDCRNEIATAERNILQAEAKIEDANERLADQQKKKAEIEEQINAEEAEVKSLAETNAALVDSFSALKNQISSLKKHIENVKKHKETLESKKKEWEEQLESIEENIAQYLPEALEIAGSRENAEERKKALTEQYKANGLTDDQIRKSFTRTMLEKKLQRVTNIIEEAHQEAGGSLDVVERELLEAEEKLQKDGRSMKNILDMYKDIRASYEKREKKLQEVDDNVEKIVSSKFRYYMNKKGHFGRIRVHRKERKLEIGVRIGEKGQAGGVIKDLKQLSGGERSFATVAFALALGGETDMPFRAMDEFDVFMDSVNRRIAMENLLSFAKENSNLQFIFLTPQDITSLYAARDQVRKQGLEIPDSFFQVVSMKPPRPRS